MNITACTHTPTTPDKTKNMFRTAKRGIIKSQLNATWKRLGLMGAEKSSETSWTGEVDMTELKLTRIFFSPILAHLICCFFCLLRGSAHI